MGKYVRLGKNTALVFLGSAGAKLMSLFMLPFYTRWLTVADYGSVDLIGIYSGLLLGIVSCTIFDALFIFPKDQPYEKKREYFSSGIGFALMTITGMALICWLVRTLGKANEWHGFVFEYLWLIFGLLAISYVQQVTQQFIRSLDKMLVYSMTGIIQTATSILFSFLLIPRWGIEGYVSSMVLGNAIALVYSMIRSGAYRYLHIRGISRNAVCEMLRYSIPLIPNGLMWFLISSLNRPVLETCSGLTAVGLFAVAGRFPNLLNTLYLLFQQAWLISVLEEAKKPTYEQFYNKMLKLVVVVQSLMAVLLAFSGKWIIELFTTPDYHSAWQYIPLLVISVIFMNVATFVGSNFAVTRESKYYFYSTIWSGGASLLLNLALIPVFSIWGACCAALISQAIGMAMRIKHSWKSARITDLGFFFKNSIFLFGSVAICLLLQGTWIMYLCMGGMCLYFYIINYRPINRVIVYIKNHEIYNRYR